MTLLLEKLSISIKIHVVKPLCSVSKLSAESVGSRRELDANCVHAADADATQLDSRRCVLGLTVYTGTRTCLATDIIDIVCVVYTLSASTAWVCHHNRTIVSALVLSRLDYCNAVLALAGLPASTLALHA